MRDFGSMQSPQNAFILNLGLESLHVRMPKHVENGQAVAEFLEAHPKVAYVNYSGLPSDKYYERAQKYLPNGGCGVVSFELKGGRAAAETFMKHLKLAAIETHVADARTCCLNPATSTHRQMNDEQLREAGVTYKVYKNTMIRRAAEGTAFAALDPHLEGPTAIAVSKTDATAAARILAEFAKKADKLEIKGGVVEGNYYDAKGMQVIATIPSREVLLGRLLGSMQSPIANFARVLNQIAEKSAEA